MDEDARRNAWSRFMVAFCDGRLDTALEVGAALWSAGVGNDLLTQLAVVCARRAGDEGALESWRARLRELEAGDAGAPLAALLDGLVSADDMLDRVGGFRDRARIHLLSGLTRVDDGEFAVGATHLYWVRMLAAHLIEGQLAGAALKGLLSSTLTDVEGSPSVVAHAYALMSWPEDAPAGMDSTAARLERGRHAVAAAEVRYGRRSPIWLLAANALVGSMREAGSLDEACALAEPVAEIALRYLGPRHYDGFQIAFNRCGLLCDLERWDEAAAHFDALVPHMDEALGPDEPMRVEALRLRADLEERRGMTNAAKATAMEAYELARRLLPERDPTRGALAARLVGLHEDDPATRRVLLRLAYDEAPSDAHRAVVGGMLQALTGHFEGASASLAHALRLIEHGANSTLTEAAPSIESMLGTLEAAGTVGSRTPREGGTRPQPRGFEWPEHLLDFVGARFGEVVRRALPAIIDSAQPMHLRMLAFCALRLSGRADRVAVARAGLSAVLDREQALLTVAEPWLYDVFRMCLGQLAPDALLDGADSDEAFVVLHLFAGLTAEADGRSADARRHFEVASEYARDDLGMVTEACLGRCYGAESGGGSIAGWMGRLMDGPGGPDSLGAYRDELKAMLGALRSGGPTPLDAYGRSLARSQVRAEIGEVLDDAGALARRRNPLQAIAQLEALSARAEPILGGHSPSLVRLQLSLADALAETGRAADAERLRRVCADRWRALGSMRHPVGRAIAGVPIRSTGRSAKSSADMPGSPSRRQFEARVEAMLQAEMASTSDRHTLQLVRRATGGRASPFDLLLRLRTNRGDLRGLEELVQLTEEADELTGDADRDAVLRLRLRSQVRMIVGDPREAAGHLAEAINRLARRPDLVYLRRELVPQWASLAVMGPNRYDDLVEVRRRLELELTAHTRGDGGHEEFVVKCMAGLAEVHSRLGDTTSALEGLRRAHALAERIGASMGTRIKVACQLAREAAMTGHLDEARRLMTRFEGGEAMQSPWGQAVLSQLKPLLLDGRESGDAVGVWLAGQPASDELFARSVAFGTARDRLMLGRRLLGLLDMGIRLALRPTATADDARRVYEVVWRRKAASAAVALAQRATWQSAPDPAAREAIAMLREHSMALARLEKTGAGPERLGAAADAVLEAQARVSESTSVTAARATMHTQFDAWLAALPRSLTVVEYLLVGPGPGFEGGEPRYVAFVVRPSADSPVQLFDLGPAGAIDRAVFEWREAVLAENPGLADAPESRARRLDRLGAGLRQRLIDPWWSDATAEDAEIRLSPDGVLWRLAFEALPLADGRLLGRAAHIGYSTSARDIGTAPDVPCREPGVSLGDPAFSIDRPGTAGNGGTRAGLTFASLPGSGVEARRVAALTGARVVMGAAATADVLQRLRGPRIVHLSTHGFALDGPVVCRAAETDEPQGAIEPLTTCGVLLAGAEDWYTGRDPRPEAADAAFTGADAAWLDLDGTRLVMLSACETGLGPIMLGEGVFGLHRAFRAAGAHNVVMALWPVLDIVALLFVDHFYSGLRTGISCLAALRETRIWLAALRIADVIDMLDQRVGPAAEPEGYGVLARWLDSALDHWDADERPLDDPAHWGAFVCVGEGTPVFEWLQR